MKTIHDISKRRFVASACGIGSSLLMASRPSFSQTSQWPARAIRFVVPAAAGGVLDNVMRILRPSLMEQLGQSIVVETKPGANFAIGAQFVAGSAPDGYTFLVGSIPLTTNPALKKVPYDILRDFAPVANMGNASAMLVVPSALGVKTLKEFIALAKAKPGELNFANAAIGSVGHLNLALLEPAAGIKTTSVLYPGQGALLTDLLANRVSFAMLSPIVALPHIQAGTLVPLAAISPERSPVLPNVPTMKESGYPQVDVDSWVGILAPAGTPANIIARLNQAVGKATQDGEVRAQFARRGITAAAPHRPEDFALRLRRETDRWPALFRQANVKPAD